MSVAYTYYIPYHGKKPAAVMINGHKLVILSQDRASLQNDLELLGADTLKPVRSSVEAEDNMSLIDKIAKNAGAGIVVAPDEAKVPDIIKNLEEQLPWLH